MNKKIHAVMDTFTHLETFFRQIVQQNIRHALREDIGSGDITALLLPKDATLDATVYLNEDALLCGMPWVEEIIAQTGKVQLEWYAEEGVHTLAGTPVLALHGDARSILSIERCLLNFLQFISGIATRCHRFVEEVAHTSVKIMDTRKTIPSLRLAQKYAVQMGGGKNHRFGLFDACLIKENHIHVAGGIPAIMEQAHKKYPDKKIEIEVESLVELEQAIACRADIVLLDNFSLEDIISAVALTKKRVFLEVSGGIPFDTLRQVAETGVDFISLGTLTKDCQSIDFSMRFSS